MISTHILNLETGYPATGVEVALLKKENSGWVEIEASLTDGDGRIKFGASIDKGDYRLDFGLNKYFEDHKKSPFFIEAPVVFRISDTARNYHVPLLLSPFGYSTYRGS